MSSEWTPDYAFDQLHEHEELIRAAGGTNEATTRLRAIDTVLFDVLGWDKQAVDAEKYCRAEGYVDYAFQHGPGICLILEAKRSGTTFVLPGRDFGAPPVGFGLLAKECSAAYDAMVQAVGYAATLGARYVAISNGHQWLITLAFVPDQALEARTVYVFESLAAVRDRFATFFHCFSPDGIRSNAIAPDLVEMRNAPAPPKLSASVPTYPVPIDRNRLTNELGVVLDLVWEEANRRDEDEGFLRECYVIPPPSASAFELAKELIDRRRHADDLSTTEVYAPTEAPMLISGYESEKPIIVLGHIGHGKSIFLRYLRQVAAKDLFANYIQIDVDFLDRPSTASEVESYILEQIDAQLLRRHAVDIRENRFVRAALHGEIERFKRTPRGQRYPEGTQQAEGEIIGLIEKIQANDYGYMTHVLKHLKLSHHASIALFFDNLDRRHDDIQEGAFLRASAMARDWACLLFVCLRPGTFFRSTTDGVLDAIAPKIINIVSPKTPILLKKRFRFAREVAQGDEDKIKQVIPASSRVAWNLPSVASVLGCCEESFFREGELADLFDSVSNGDVRALLRYAKSFLVSGHLDTRKILEKIPKGYRIPPHEALRALLYGDYWHYDPDRSVFVNLFDIYQSDPRQHFSRVMVLDYLRRIPEGSPTHGFCGREELLEYLCQLGFCGNHAEQTIGFLCGKKCIEERVYGPFAEGPRGELRLASLGRYHIGHLVNQFQYIDAVVVDTPITDESIRRQVCDVRKIDDRVARAKCFLEYLRECSRLIQDPDVQSLWTEVESRVRTDIAKVEASVRAAGRRKTAE